MKLSENSQEGRAGDEMPTGNKHIQTAKHIVDNIELYLIYVFYIYLLFIVISEVVRRYGLGMSSLWSGETARYSFLYITYLGISLAAYRRTHIRIDAIYSYVSQRTESYLYLLSNIAMLIFGVYAIWYTIPLIETSLNFGSKTQALDVNRAFFQAAISIGFSLMIIRILQRTYYDILDIRAGRPVFKGENIFLEDD